MSTIASALASSQAGSLLTSCSFNGTNEYLSGPSHAGSPGRWTFSAWVRVDNLDQNKMVLTAARDLGGYDYILINRFGSIQYYSGTSGNYQSYNYTANNVIISTQKWYHIVVQVTGGIADIYLDGQQLPLTRPAGKPYRVDSTHILNGYTLYVGVRRRSSSSIDSYFAGEMAEVYLISGETVEPSQFRTEFSDSGYPVVDYEGNRANVSFYYNFRDENSMGASTFSTRDAAPVNIDSTNQFKYNVLELL